MSFWPGDQNVFPIAEPFIKQWEGFSLAPYLDSANIPTIGWGTIRYPNGQSVTMSDPSISQDYAEDCFRFDLQGASAMIGTHFTQTPTLNQAAAMLSLSYNIG